MNASIFVSMPVWASVYICKTLALCISYPSVGVTFRCSKRSTFPRSKRSTFRRSKRTPDLHIIAWTQIEPLKTFRDSDHFDGWHPVHILKRPRWLKRPTASKTAKCLRPAVPATSSISSISSINQGLKQQFHHRKLPSFSGSYKRGSTCLGQIQIRD